MKRKTFLIALAISLTCTFTSVYAEDIQLPELKYVQAEYTEMLGDLNNDGSVDSIDLALMKMYLLGMTTEINFKNADMNSDDMIDKIDYDLLRQRFRPPIL